VKQGKDLRKKALRSAESLLWTRPDILFDGTETFGAKPIREALADRDIRKPAPQRAKAQRQRADGANYTVRELATEWGLSTDKIRELFKGEPGVIKLKDEKAGKKRKRQYVTLRIPPEVAQRVAKRMS
jgi:hypothetical protein